MGDRLGSTALPEGGLHPATARASYSTRFVPIPRLDAATRLEMAHLYLSHYDASSVPMFMHDLEAKDEVLLVHADGDLAGFSTLRTFASRWNGMPLRVVYSGDTIVDRAHWGQHALAFAWIRRAGELRREHPDCALYWFLLVKGHRTFRYLPAFAKSFYPHWSLDTAHLKPLADALALEMFPEDYNPATGLVEFDPSRGQLQADIAVPSAAAGMREDVRFFMARNPAYTRGHELVCLCELDERNLKPLARRIFLGHDDARGGLGAAHAH